MDIYIIRGNIMQPNEVILPVYTYIYIYDYALLFGYTPSKEVTLEVTEVGRCREEKGRRKKIKEEK